MSEHPDRQAIARALHVGWHHVSPKRGESCELCDATAGVVLALLPSLGYVRVEDAIAAVEASFDRSIERILAEVQAVGNAELIEASVEMALAVSCETVRRLGERGDQG